MDSLDPGLPLAFATCVRQDTVIFSASDLIEQNRGPCPWRPWLDFGPRLRRACLQCVLTTGWWSRLMANVPVMLSCPEHGVRLMPAGQVRVADAGYGVDEDVPDQVSEAVTVMDRRTHEGVTTGMVTLPRRTVHVGVWFRLLRTVLHDVNAPISCLRTAAAKRALTLIWKTASMRQRAGQHRWLAYEEMDWQRQAAMLEGAATAMYLVETGAIEARGTLGALLRPEDGVPVSSEPPEPDSWEVFLSDYNAILDAAIDDPAGSIQLLRLFTGRCRRRNCYENGRRDLIKCGLRAKFLPAWPIDGDRPDLDDAV